MKLEIRGNGNVAIQNIRLGEGLTANMRIGELIVNAISVPFILLREENGKIEEWLDGFESDFCVRVYKHLCAESDFEKMGYESLSINSGTGLLSIYVSGVHLEELFSALCMVSM